MADILIRGMEMPKNDEILVFDEWHGKVYARSTANIGTKSYEVLPLPEGHGRLIDADKLMKEEQVINRFHVVSACDVIIAPTIVPADVTDIDVWNKKEGGTDDG